MMLNIMFWLCLNVQTLLPDTPVSKLHPYDTGAESLVRWTSTPLYTAATYDKTDLSDRVVAGV
jgi:hypothetical protein